MLLATSALLLGLFILHFTVYGQDKSSFPDGFDAVQAAPTSHKVLFENAVVRVLDVSVSPNTTVPMHHHRWPSLLVSWDTGGRSSHVRYRCITLRFSTHRSQIPIFASRSSVFPNTKPALRKMALIKHGGCNGNGY